MEYFKDTIAAISTPRGTGALHVIRLSGEDSFSCINHLIPALNLLDIPARKVIYTKLYEGSEILDEVLLTKFNAPASYTGENMIEISCHGNQFLAERILGAVLNTTRLAHPGEFTQRAYLNNKLDLTQAEAVGDLLSAKTRYAQKSALNQLEGKLSAYIKPFLDLLTHHRIELELEIDFSEDDTGNLDINKMKEELELLLANLKKLAESGRDGIILREGFKISLVGQPNVGKSSIFNRMLETERAIVTPEPGTTRDYLEEAFALKGFLVRLYDTAGIRKADNKIEQIGIERSFSMMKNSDLVVYVSDGNDDRQYLNKIISVNKPLIKVINKSDMLSDKELLKFTDEGFIPSSTVMKDGLEILKAEILKMININPSSLSEMLLTNNRHIALVKKAIENIQQALQAIENEMSIEFIAFDLQEASKNLEEISGIISSDDILNKIFSDFCIGK